LRDLSIVLRQGGGDNPRWNPRQAVNISLRIENYADRALDLATRELGNRILDPDYLLALNDLRRLDSAADALYDRINQNPNNPNASREHFTSLVNAFSRALDSTNRVNFRSGVRLMLQNLRGEIQDLSRMYQGGDLDSGLSSIQRHAG
jgi:hypothetical protein